MSTIKTKTNRELFLEKLAPHISVFGMERVYDAYMFAKYAHKQQYRTGGGRYFEHPRAVAEIIINELGIVNDWKVVSQALLHDVLEDTWLLTPKLAEKTFGKDISHGLSLLTRGEEHSNAEFAAYVGAIAESGLWRVILVKLCDRLHNLRTMNEFSIERQKRYIRETEEHFSLLFRAFSLFVPRRFAKKAIVLKQLFASEMQNAKARAS